MARTLIEHFDSPGEFGRDCAARDLSRDSHGYTNWFGGESFGSAIAKCVGGDNALVSEAERLVDQFRDAVDISLLMPRWALEPVGAFPSVPDFLAGQPECMYRRVQDESERAPLTIWVCVTSSGGVDARALLKRGIAVTALFMALSATRPVELRVFSGLGAQSGAGNKIAGNRIVTVRLAAPIALAEAAFCVSSSAFSRGLTYEWLAKVQGASGGWPTDVSHGTHAQRIEEWRKLLGAGEADVIFPHVFNSDPDLADPIGYAKQVIATYAHEGE